MSPFWHLFVSLESPHVLSTFSLYRSFVVECLWDKTIWGQTLDFGKCVVSRHWGPILETDRIYLKLLPLGGNDSSQGSKAFAAFISVPWCRYSTFMVVIGKFWHCSRHDGQVFSVPRGILSIPLGLCVVRSPAHFSRTGSGGAGLRHNHLEQTWKDLW